MHKKKARLSALGALFNILLPLVYLSAALKTPNMLCGAFLYTPWACLKNNQYRNKGNRAGQKYQIHINTWP